MQVVAMKIYEMTALELRDAIIRGEYKVEEVVSAFLERIEKDPLNCYITVVEEQALEEARKKDKEIKEYTPDKVPPLFGVPIAVKDNISTKGIRTTCASRMLENYVPVFDATVVELLKQAGAIIVGKTNMDEFAMGSTNETSYFGPVLNPWDRSRVPGGSSGGSAATVAARQVPLALGTDTGGSIRAPASYCGIVGLKPTYGMVSRYGLIAYADSLEQIGPMARTVEDLALLFDVIERYDPRDSTSVPPKFRPSTGRHLQELRTIFPEEISGLRMALISELMSEGIESEVSHSIMRSVEIFEKYDIMVDEISIPELRYALPAYYIIAMAEASSNLARYDGIRYGFSSGAPGKFYDVIAENRRLGFGEEVRRRILLGTFVLSAGYYGQYYLKALKVRRLIKEALDRAFKSFDILISPTMPILPPKLGERIKDPLTLYLMDLCTVPANLAGVPALSIPCAFVNGLPVGMQLMAPPFHEDVLFKAAYIFQKETRLYEMSPPV